MLNNLCRLSKKKYESLNLGPKLPHLGIFTLTFEKKLLSRLKQLLVFQNVKFRAKSKILKFRKNYCHI